VRKTESALRVIQLRRRNPEVGKNSIGLATGEFTLQDLRELAETGMRRIQPGVAFCELSGGLHGRRVAIKRKQAALLSESLEYRCAVAAAAKTAVDIKPVGANCQLLKYLIPQYRDMLIHPATPRPDSRLLLFYHPQLPLQRQ
jgi:hypothetical protein